VKQIVGIASLSMGIGCVVGGWLAGRYDHRKLLTISYCIYVVSGACGLFLTDLYALLASRVVVGASAAVLSTTAIVVLSERSDGNRRNALLGLIVSFSMAGAVITYPAAGLLGHLSWRLVFLLYLIPVPIAVACVFLPPMAPQKKAAEDKAKTVFYLPVRILFIAFMSSCISFTTSLFAPFRFKEIGIDDPRLIGVSLMMMTIAGAVAAGLYGTLRRKLDIYQSLAAGYAITACGMATLSVAPSFWVMVVGTTLMGIGVGNLSPNSFALAAQSPDHVRAHVIGLVKGVKYVAPAVSVFALQPIDNAYGTHAALTAVSLAGVIMLIYVLIDRAPLRDQTKLTGEQAKQAAA
jgi:MFS family permease